MSTNGTLLSTQPCIELSNCFFIGGRYRTLCWEMSQKEQAAMPSLVRI